MKAPTTPIWAVHGLMFLSSVIVSTSFTVGKAIAHGLDPAVLTLLRFIAAVLIFLPYIVKVHGLKLPAGRALIRYSIISASIVAFFWCMFESLRYTTALNTSALFTLVPGIAGIYGVMLISEKLGKARICALICGMVGALWIIFRGNMQEFLSLNLNRGDLIFLAGCFSMGLYTPLVKKLHRNEPMTLMTFWVLATGVGWLLLLSIPALPNVQWQAVDMSVWAGILYLAVFSTIITFFLTQYAILYIGSTRVMAYSYFYPGMVLVIDFLLGHGLPSAMTLPGVIVVLAATVFLQSGTNLAHPTK